MVEGQLRGTRGAIVIHLEGRGGRLQSLGRVAVQAAHPLVHKPELYVKLHVYALQPCVDDANAKVFRTGYDPDRVQHVRYPTSIVSAWIDEMVVVCSFPQLPKLLRTTRARQRIRSDTNQKAGEDHGMRTYQGNPPSPAL